MASKRAQRRKQHRKRCTGKRCYTDLEHARHDAGYLSMKQSKRLEAYRCVDCACIHVGHRPANGGCPVARERSAA